MQKDLFGKRIKERRPRFEWSLERIEKRSLPVRAERVRWLDRIMPRYQYVGLPLETYYVFEEAKSSFVYGCFVSSVVLAAAFVEHWLALHLSNRGYSDDVKRGLDAMVKCCRKNKLINPTLLGRIDKLRKIRNPFVHLKEYEHKFNLGQRLFKNRSGPDYVLENDAKESLITMYSVFKHAFKNT